MSNETEFDAIVVGSGITGGWAAKELTEKGLRVLMIERGPMIEHQADYKTEMLAPWELPNRGYGDQKLWKEQYAVQSDPSGRYFDEWTYKHFVNDLDHPYKSESTPPFAWRRSYQLGGRSLVWGRQTYRWNEMDFEANLKDGHGVDWPIRYNDLAPWYEYVEKFIGVQGTKENLDVLPDGYFLGSFSLTPPEEALREKLSKTYKGKRILTVSRSAHLTEAKDGRSACQFRSICARGCTYGAYFSTQSSTLPAAKATGRLTLVTDTVVESLQYNAKARRVSGVRAINTKTGKASVYTSRIIFLCASTINTVALLLRSKSEAWPQGMANSSGTLGKYIMDHVSGAGAGGAVGGFEQVTTFGNRPTPVIIPRFRNIEKDDAEFVRGYALFGAAVQLSWRYGESTPGLGEEAKAERKKPGPWVIGFNILGEALPYEHNRVTLAKNGVDKDGLPQIQIDYSYGENEKNMLLDAEQESRAMLELMDISALRSRHESEAPGNTVHEMGGARMGRDPKTSVVNGNNQTHDIDNLFITDGACMTSSASVNPSLTYMALTARACSYAARLFKDGVF